MNLAIAIFLGLVQGITEFIPVSSSGHLLLAARLVDLEEAFVFGVLLNIGTLGALIYYSRQRLTELLKQILNKDFILAGKIALATIPAVVAGFLLEDQVRRLEDSAAGISIMLVLIGGLMLVVSERKNTEKELSGISWRIAFIVGCAQALALLPGTSRSGITILAGLLLGMRRSLAAEWSFLMAIPIITGASLKVALSNEGVAFVGEHFIEVLVGNIVSFVVGLLAIRVLLQSLKKHSLKQFGWYRIMLGVVVLVVLVL